ncbi:uncharacterized protein BJ212DRAFT_1483705 [Suillus subaureus]|uniref:Uncharacterized protein n=1 Tax=Suillus subaureus TaxID=48587 RepID=A0A9P7E613_9AGAM|nr:uncharacterized protein BJ212DRAFT_1483705 [Suillus subaureus]KAG1811456.1 hypothetical protein BJ212DRAFT_1483705 [Suillus subaureus]
MASYFLHEFTDALTRPTWTHMQAAALHGIRTTIGVFKPTFSQAQLLTECAQVPSKGIHISCELALPSSQIPASIHSTLIRPGQVPVFFYTDAPSESLDVKKDVKVIPHVHRGGNVSRHPTEKRFITFFSRILHTLGKKSGIQGSSAHIIAAPSHRLVMVPENLFPAALQDLFSAYHHLFLRGFAAKNITITGNSAGRNLGAS